jgi:hypothetical protein
VSTASETSVEDDVCRDLQCSKNGKCDWLIALAHGNHNNSVRGEVKAHQLPDLRHYADVGYPLNNQR